MATVSKSFTENEESSYKSTWTISITGTDMTLSSSTFTYPKPTIKAKYTSSSTKGWACCEIDSPYLNEGRIDGYTYAKKGGGSQYTLDPVSWAKGSEQTLTVYGTASTNSTSSFFNTSNPTSKTVDVTVRTYGIDTTSSSKSDNTANYNGYSSASTLSWGTIGVLTLDAPPSVTLGTPTYSTPHYAGLGAYTVPITSAEAYYGGEISKITLTVGQESTVQTYSSSSISSVTISVTPTIAGTYTPTIIVEDSRGQITTNTLAQIVVNSYIDPSLDFDVFRSNSSGVRDDEGAYGLITATVSFTDAIADLTQPTVKINNTTTNNVTWYSVYNGSTGVSSAISDWSTVSSGDTIYGLINGSFSQTDSYQITVKLDDSLGGNSSEITQTLSTAFYTIDFQAGGKEIAFGLPANDNLASYPNGLFKCGMDAVFNGGLTATGDTTLTTGNTEIENPYFSLDTTASPGTTDGDLYAAITALGWASDVIV